MKLNIRMEKEHSIQLQELLKKDKEVLELECEKLRKELISVNTKVRSACILVEIARCDEFDDVDDHDL